MYKTPSRTGHLILILGPSGSGKNTLKDHIAQTFNDRLSVAVSYTTRAIRPGEKEGKTYYYTDVNTFKNMITEDRFLEWVEYSGNYYGTNREQIDDIIARGEIVIQDTERRGLQQIREHFPKHMYTFIYIDGGSWEQLQKRILKRAPISDEELALRKNSFEQTEKLKPEADIIIKNYDGKVLEAKREIESAVDNILTTHGW